MAFFDNIHFPYFSFQELNLDWLLKEVKRIAGFMPEGGNVGDILTRKSDGAEWEVPSAVTLDIASLPEDTQILDNDQLIFYDISSQANRKIKPPNLMDSMCSNGTPLMNGTGSAGTSKKPARYDHVHPTDTTRAPANYFQNSALKVSNGGTGATTASAARANLGACPAQWDDGVVISFSSQYGAIFCANRNSNGKFVIDIPTDLVIPSGKTFTQSLSCSWIRGNGTSVDSPTLSYAVTRVSPHFIRLEVTDTNNAFATNYVYSLLLTGDITMS